jgi:Na+-driven multidrug efflux pump
MFLSWFDPNALAATVPATLVTMTLTAVFLGLAGYVGVFVAQYYGAREDARIGPMVWQGFYTTGLSLLVVVPVYIYIIPLFELIGHDPILQVMEADYARILTLTIPIAIISASLSGFFSGIGRTSVVMWSNLLITLVNIILDYGLIFGHWGMPRMGVAGAAWATFISLLLGTLTQLWVFFAPSYRRSYNTLSVWLAFRLDVISTPAALWFTCGLSISNTGLGLDIICLVDWPNWCRSINGPQYRHECLYDHGYAGSGNEYCRINFSRPAPGGRGSGVG